MLYFVSATSASARHTSKSVLMKLRRACSVSPQIFRVSWKRSPTSNFRREDDKAGSTDACSPKTRAPILRPSVSTQPYRRSSSNTEGIDGQDQRPPNEFGSGYAGKRRGLPNSRLNTLPQRRINPCDEHLVESASGVLDG